MNRLRQKGVVATEAVLSFGLLLFVILLLWSVARLVYDQTNLETATRFAAQAALASYLQNAPILCTDSDVQLGDEDFFDESPEGRRRSKCYQARYIAGENALSVLFANTENPSRSLASEAELGGGDPGGYGDLVEGLVDNDPISRDPEYLQVDCALLRRGQTEPQFTGSDGCDISSEDITDPLALVVRITLQTQSPSGDRFLDLFTDLEAKATAYGWRRIN